MRDGGSLRVAYRRRLEPRIGHGEIGVVHRGQDALGAEHLVDEAKVRQVTIPLSGMNTWPRYLRVIVRD